MQLTKTLTKKLSEKMGKRENSWEKVESEGVNSGAELHM
jgi:hypothetical protein